MADDQDIGVNNQSPDAQFHVEGDDNDYTVIKAESNYVGSNSFDDLFVRAISGEAVINPGYGIGGFFEGGYGGVYARANSTDHTGTSYGVEGYATGTAGTRIGVIGQASNTGGNVSFGVYGNATNANINYGVYGTAIGNNATNWAGYFAGNTYVEDTLKVDEEIHINSDGTRNDRLVVMDASSGDAVYIKNLGLSNVNVGGYGIEVDAGYRGIDLDINDMNLNGSHYGYYINNFTTTNTELTGSQYGVYIYVSGARTSTGGNYSIYAQQANTAGSGSSWAGYFSGDVRITGTLDNTSDARLKKDVEDMEDALEIIQQLQPKTYQFKADEYPHMALDERPQIGFIAQDVEKVLPQLVRTAIHPEFINDEGEESDIPNSPAVDVKSINYIGIIPVLTQGIKEISAEMDDRDKEMKALKMENENIKTENSELKAEMAELKNIVGELKQQFSNMENNMQNCCLESNTPSNKEAITTIELSGNGEQAILEQNAPNPFNIQTQIRYYIPSSTIKAQMVITDNRGAILKTVNLTEIGFGTVFIKAGELAAGTYAYTLFIDGNKVATKQMVLMK